MSFLEIIQKFIDKNTMSFDSIPVNNNQLTYNMKKSILSFMKVYTSNVEYQDLEVFINFDSNNYAYLECRCGRVKLLILNDRLLYDTSNLIGQKISESNFINKTISLEFIDYTKKSNKKEKFNRYRCYNEFITIANDICDYVSYLDNLYTNMFLNEGIMVYEDNTKDSIFTKWEEDLSYQNRFKYLESLNPIFVCNCISDKKNILAYKAYVYKSEDIYLVICESNDGKKHTKIMYYDNISSLDDFKSKLSCLLTLTDEEVLISSNVCQVKTNDFVNYKNIISYSFGHDSRIDNYVKSSINRCRKI